MSFFFTLSLCSARSLGHPQLPDHAVKHTYPDSDIYSLDVLTNTFPGQITERDASIINVTGTGDYTCGPGKPCSNGACCGESGWCGYSPTYCGSGCQSNCAAKAECGQYAADPGQTCPLNVCCSEYGFCGTTSDFCSGECQSNCDQPKPSGGGSNVQQRIVGYWEAWNLDHPCGTMNPSEIPVSLLTHLNVAFGYINQDFQITNMDGVSTAMYKNAAAVKSKNPNLKVLIALGGWSFSDPGKWQNVFPSLASTAANRATFIANLMGWLSEYGYDGVGMYKPACTRSSPTSRHI
jgi:chitinase